MTPAKVVEAIGSLKFEHAFNPYSDICEVFDLPSAPAIRREILLDILRSAADSEVDAIWIGRDLGHRGGRRTGMALTDDIHMVAHAARWGIEVSRPTVGQPVAERTARMVWDILNAVSAPVFLWNVFPLHPHEPERPLTNRAHTARERGAGEDILAMIVDLLKPARLVAIGNDAAATMLRVAGSEHEVLHVRHPSYGGHRDFVAAMTAAYSLEAPTHQKGLFD